MDSSGRAGQTSGPGQRGRPIVVLETPARAVVLGGFSSDKHEPYDDPDTFAVAVVAPLFRIDASHGSWLTVFCLPVERLSASGQTVRYRRATGIAGF